MPFVPAFGTGDPTDPVSNFVNHADSLVSTRKEVEIQKVLEHIRQGGQNIFPMLVKQFSDEAESNFRTFMLSPERDKICYLTDAYVSFSVAKSLISFYAERSSILASLHPSFIHDPVAVSCAWKESHRLLDRLIAVMSFVNLELAPERCISPIRTPSPKPSHFSRRSAHDPAFPFPKTHM